MTLEGRLSSEGGDWFEAFVARVLVAHLRPGDVVVMDNLSSHKRASAIQKIEKTAATVRFLPPYSPDLNPIKHVCSMVKHGLRLPACRSRKTLWDTMPTVLKTVTPAEARNCITHCGYTLKIK